MTKSKSILIIFCITTFLGALFGDYHVIRNDNVYGASTVSHPLGNEYYNGMLDYGDRLIVRETAAAKAKAVKDYVDQTVDEFKGYIETNLPKNITERAEYEIAVARLGQLYNADTVKNADCGKKVIHALILSAQNYDKIENTIPANIFFKSAHLTPIFLAIAYDNVYNYNNFAEFDSIYKVDTKAVIEGHYRKIAAKMYDDNKNIYINNLGGFAIKHLCGLGVILESPEIIRHAIVMIDSAFDESQWHGDGMWSEGTVSYGQQLYGNTMEAVKMLKLYVDPPDYVDTVLNPPIKLNKTDLTSRWPITSTIKATTTAAKYVNDSLMAFHDTHPAPLISNNPELPITNFEPVELNHFGMYGMKSGNTTDAQQVNLLFPALTEGIPYGGGHYHGNQLALSMFAGGMEVLPDAGYPFAVDNNRYFHMSTVAHNTSWITTKGLAYKDCESQLSRAKVLAYDNKDANSMVQLIEASDLGAVEQNIDTKRRLLLQIKVSDTRSYVVDVQRLKGGDVHENFLRSSEDEDTVLTTNLSTTALGTDIGTYLKTNKKIGEMASGTWFKDASVSDTGEAFSFSWKGQESQTTFDGYLKEVQGGQTFFSKMPSLRRTLGEVALKDNFPVPHLYQRREVTPSDVSQFSGVYEGYRSGESKLINNVTWNEVQNSKMSSIITVDLGEFEDIIYVNDNMTPYKFDNVEFSGETAILRRNKVTKEPLWGYINGSGYIKFGSRILKGADNFTANVVDVIRSIDGENKITLSKNIPNDFVGEWVVSNLPDETGIAHKITAINGATATVHNDVGYSLTNGGVKSEYFPSKFNTVTKNYKIANHTKDKLIDRVAVGDVVANIRKSTFGTLEPTDAVFTENGKIITELQPNKNYSVQTYLEKGQILFVAQYTQNFRDNPANTALDNRLSDIFTNNNIGEAVINNVSTPANLAEYYPSGRLKNKVTYRTFVLDSNIMPR